MKAILLSTRPKWCEKICHKIGIDKNGKPVYEKPIEVRKTKPSISTPFKVFIYCSKQRVNGEILLTYDKKVEGRNRGFRDKGDIPLAGKVIGEFICDKIEEFSVGSLRGDDIVDLACLSYKEIIDYFYKPEELDGKTAKHGYAWHITDLKIYDKPKGLWQFYKCGAKSFEELSNTREICEYCKYPSKGLFLCEGRFCDEVYEEYLEQEFALTRPPQSWMYIEE